MRPVALLARLNGIDLAVDVLEARLVEIAEALREPKEIQAARQALASAEATVARCRTTQRDREWVQTQAVDKLARARQRLYSGQVRNPKELEDLQQDAQQSQRQLDHADDELLEALIATETALATQSDMEAALGTLTTQWETARTALQEEQARLKQRLPAERARQAVARRAAPADLLPLYDRLRSRRAGRAVAELEDDMCSACRVAVPSSKLEAARYGEELVYCGNCGRLLWGE